MLTGKQFKWNTLYLYEWIVDVEEHCGWWFPYIPLIVSGVDDA